jgi:Dolichyl-phosphate-mannose-protein mannosyltransferase
MGSDQSIVAGERPPLSYGLLFGLSGAIFLIHALLSGRYGYFRDELYYLACGRHLAWGYVDHAPMIGLVARVALLLGGSLHVLRLIPALAGALMVALTILIAREIGGGRFAQGLAGLCVMTVPVFLATDGLLTMNAFEPLFWMGCIYVLIRIVNTGDSRLWIWFGVLAGLGLENKHSTLFFGFAVAIAILLTAQRRELAKPWVWFGFAIALLIFLPNLLWEIHNHFPTLEDLENVRKTGKNITVGPIGFLGQQILLMNPLLLPVWLAGLWYFFRARGGRWRVVGWIYVVLLITLMALKGKNYYLAPIYPMLFAGGGVAVESWLDGPRATQRRWPKVAIVTVIVLAGVAFGPLTLPVLSPEQYIRYSKALHASPPKTEIYDVGPLPQFLGDQFGWEQMVSEVAKVYESLPPSERSQTAIFASNYGAAGAIDMFGPKYGLPAAISGHQTYFFWGPRGFSGNTLIVLQGDRETLERACGSVEVAGVHYNPYGMVEENWPIYVCHGLKVSLPAVWPQLKHWN